MSPKSFLIISAILGLVAGLGTTYPIAMRFLPSIIIWGVAGLIAGALTKDNREAIRAGIVYGIVLAISFLLSRFGGSVNKLPAYFLFILGMSVFAAVGGIIAAFVGSKMRQLFSKKTL